MRSDLEPAGPVTALLEERLQLLWALVRRQPSRGGPGRRYHGVRMHPLDVAELVREDDVRLTRDGAGRLYYDSVEVTADPDVRRGRVRFGPK